MNRQPNLLLWRQKLASVEEKLREANSSLEVSNQNLRIQTIKKAELESEISDLRGDFEREQYDRFETQELLRSSVDTSATLSSQLDRVSTELRCATASMNSLQLDWT